MTEHLPGQMELAVEELSGLDSLEGLDDANAALHSAMSASGESGGRLTRLELQNFKGFEDVAVDFNDFNVLVGTNNSGKSTILQAIKLGYSLLRLHFNHGIPSGQGRSGLGRSVPPGILPVAELRDLWFQKKWRSGNKAVVCRITMVFTGGLRFTVGMRLLYGGLNSTLLEYPQGLTTDQLNRVWGLAPVLVPSSVGIVSQEEYRNPGRVDILVATGRHNEALRNMLRDLQVTDEQRFNRIAELVKRHFSVDLQYVKFDEATEQFVDARYVESSADLDLFSAGAGLLQVVQLLAFALRGSAGLVLLDEPDAHLHSSMQLLVVSMLEQLSREFHFQVVISTHSKEIINSVESNLLLPVSRTGELQALEPHASALAVLQELGAIDNVDLYGLFTLGAAASSRERATSPYTSGSLRNWVALSSRVTAESCSSRPRGSTPSPRKQQSRSSRICRAWN